MAQQSRSWATGGRTVLVDAVARSSPTAPAAATSTPGDVDAGEGAEGAREPLGARPLSSADEPAFDIRQQLVVIAALADAASHDTATPEVRREAITTIAEKARSLLDLCRAAASPGSPRPLSLAAVAAPVVAERAAATGCAIDLDVRRVAVAADESALRLALWGLLDVACAAAGRAGKVRVTAQCTGDRVFIEITDSGPRVGAGPSPPTSIGVGVIAPLARREGWQLQIDSDVIGGATTLLTVPSAPMAGQGASVVLCGETRLGGDALAGALERLDVDVLAVEHDVRRCVEALQRHLPAVCIMGDALPEGDMRVLLERVEQASPGARVVLVSDGPASTVGMAARNGVVAEVVSANEGLEQVAAAIERCIRDGRRNGRRLRASAHERVVAAGLTPREHEVLELLVRGRETAALATELGITYATARAHIQKVLLKLNVHSKLEAVSYAVRNGIVPAPGP